MKIGKNQIAHEFYASLAFVLAIGGQTLLCGILLGFVVLTEQEGKLNYNVIQALLLSLTHTVVSTVLHTINLFGAIPFLNSISSVFIGLVTGIVNLLVLVFAVISLFKVAKGGEASVPLYCKIAQKVCG